MVGKILERNALRTERAVFRLPSVVWQGQKSPERDFVFARKGRKRVAEDNEGGDTDDFGSCLAQALQGAANGGTGANDIVDDGYAFSGDSRLERFGKFVRNAEELVFKASIESQGVDEVTA